MNDDIKRVLSRIYESQTLTEASGARDAMDNLNKDVKVKGSFNAKAFGTMLGMQASEAALLTSFINKHKSGQTPSRMEILAAADAFRALVDADNQVTNQALTMLRRVHATQANESIRLTKEGIEECWGDMQAPAAPASNDETMTVSISMPNKNISVTTDSTAEIMNLLKLAGISTDAANSDTEQADQNNTVGFSQNTDDKPQLVGAGPMVVSMGEDESGEQEDEDKDEQEDEQVGEAGQTKSPYAIGMAQAMKSTGDKPPLDKDTIKKAHEIAKAIMKKEDVNEEEIDENAFNQAAAAAAREGKDEFEFPKGSGKMHPVKMDKDTAHQMESSDESARILQLAGIDESKFANTPAGTSMDEPTEYDSLPSGKGTGAGKPDYGTRQSNMGGENPMAHHNLDIDEAFDRAMDEYRKFVAESIKSKK